MKILIGRHQKSIANSAEIIQGDRFQSVGLSAEGRLRARCLAFSLKNEGIEKIYCSHYARAHETALAYGGILKIPVEKDVLLNEFKPGILGDMLKIDAKQKYPRYWKLWSRRGDLDGIPGAETGDELQARVVCFIERYRESFSNDLIISHAGFIRCLVNTIRGCKRTTPVNVSFKHIHRYDENPWKCIKSSRLPFAKESEATLINTFDKQFVLKRLVGDREKMKFQYEISYRINELETGLVSQVLSWDIRNGYAVQVLNYLPGEHLYGCLSSSKSKIIIQAVFRLHRILRKITTKHKPRLFNKLESLASDVNGLPIASELCAELMNSRRLYDLSLSEQVLINYDLHRMNLIFDGSCVKVLDLGGYVYGPAEFQPASLFASAFLLEDVENFNIEWLMNQWPIKLDMANVVFLVKIRLLFGVAFFERRRLSAEYNNDDERLLKRYLRSLAKIKTLHY